MKTVVIGSDADPGNCRTSAQQRAETRISLPSTNSHVVTLEEHTARCFFLYHL